MISNQLIITKKLNVTNLKCETNMLVIIDGRQVRYEGDFFNIMEMEFRFPRPCDGYMDIFLDWIMDLTWLEYDKITLVIKNKKEFLSNNFLFKVKVLTDFVEIVLPFWEEEVVRCVVEGKPKQFNVYLVDEIE